MGAAWSHPPTGSATQSQLFLPQVIGAFVPPGDSKGHSELVTCAAVGEFDGDGGDAVIATGGWDGTVRRWRWSAAAGAGGGGGLSGGAPLQAGPPNRSLTVCS